MFNTFEKIEASISAIRAFNDLMTAAVLQGDDMSLIASGMFRLLDTQVEILAEASGEVRSAYNALEKGRQELSANSALNSNPEVSAQTNPHELRASFIHEKIGEGYGAGEIASALNLKKETVEKTIRKLVGSEAKGQASNKLRRSGE
jgi:DNA-binding CsgD family transcriptional regulator